MSKTEFTMKMKKISEETDKEARHLKADNLMIHLIKSLGYTSGAEIFESMPRYYS